MTGFERNGGIFPFIPVFISSTFLNEAQASTRARVGNVHAQILRAAGMVLGKICKIENPILDNLKGIERSRSLRRMKVHTVNI